MDRKVGAGFVWYYHFADKRRLEIENDLLKNDVLDLFRLKRGIKERIEGEMSGVENMDFLDVFIEENI